MRNHTSTRSIFSAPLVACAALLVSSTAILGDDSVPATPEEVKPLSLGASVPAAKIRTAEGQEVILSELVAGKPTVIVFYRGGWCPYCNRHLSDLQRVEEDIRAAGFQILALSMDKPELLPRTTEKVKTSYTLLSDSKAEAATSFGVAFKLDDKTFTKYKKRYKIDIEADSGEDHHILPVPAIFVTDRAGVIKWVHTNPNYKDRLDGKEVLEAALKSR